MLKILALPILSLCVIFISACDGNKTGNDKAATVATDEGTEENVVVSASEAVDGDAEEGVPVKRTMRRVVKNTRTLKEIASLPTGFEIPESLDKTLEQEHEGP